LFLLLIDFTLYIFGEKTNVDFDLNDLLFDRNCCWRRRVHWPLPLPTWSLRHKAPRKRWKTANKWNHCWTRQNRWKKFVSRRFLIDNYG